jgi:hypothetical protein
VIQLSGYTHDEKLHIAWRFLLPKQLAQNGLSEAHVQVTEPALLSIVTQYTREAGVRALEHLSLCYHLHLLWPTPMPLADWTRVQELVTLDTIQS